MNNEEKILSILEKMDNRLNRLEDGQIKLERCLLDVHNDIEMLKEDVADIKFNVKEIWKDLSLAESRIQEHVRDYHPR